MSLDTQTLLGVFMNLRPHDTFLLSLMFPDVVTFDTSEIAFDRLGDNFKLAPFVSPYVAGKPHVAQGHTTNKFKPAYIKPKDAVDPERILKRVAGEQFGGSLSAADRVEAIRVAILDEHRKMIKARMEWMAAQFLKTGKIVVAGEDYPSQEVDFGRDANHTIQLAGGARWDQVGTPDPNQDLEDWMALVDAPTTHIIFGKTAWKLYRQDALTDKLLDSRRGSETTLELAPAQMFASYKGRLGGGSGPEAWTYTGWYKDENDTKVNFIDDNGVYLVSQGVRGVRAYGAILDPKAEYQALEMFPKNWVSEDPAVEYLMTQSAPLPVLPMPDSTIAAKVTT